MVIAKKIKEHKDQKEKEEQLDNEIKKLEETIKTKDITEEERQEKREEIRDKKAIKNADKKQEEYEKEKELEEENKDKKFREKAQEELKNTNDTNKETLIASRVEELKKEKEDKIEAKIKNSKLKNDKKLEKINNEKLAKINKLEEEVKKDITINKYTTNKEEDSPKEINYKKEIMVPIFNRLFPIIIVLIYLAIIAISVLSLLSLILYIIKTLYSIIILIFNDDMLNYNTIEYISLFDYLNVAKDNYLNEPFFIFLEQYITYRTIDFWVIGFLTLSIPFILYLILFIYYKFKGDLYNITGSVEFQELVLQLMIIYIIFLIIHVAVYNNIFTNKLYPMLKDVSTQCIDIDKYVYSRLYLSDDIDTFYSLLEQGDDRDLINNIKIDIIDNKDNLRKKIFTYILYKYLGNNIEVSNVDSRELLKKYLTGVKKTDNIKNLTFVGLLNYKKKVIKKYYTDLDIFEKFSNLNDIKKTLDDDINELNKKIISAPSFIKPYFYILLYIICILITNFIFLFIISYLIVNDKNTDSPFPPQISVMIKDNFVLPITNLFINK